ncbi:MAG: hypothetical protein M1158_01340 [Candidatus Marsarchaeota archaeon]|nr:hypothetical protein [Candidatus Marsarchaeota archaeon]
MMSGKNPKGIRMGHEAMAIGMAALMLLWFASAASAQSTSYVSGALSLANLVISPQPVVAGSNVTVQFQLYNDYNNPLQNVNLQLEAQNPIINVSPSHTYITDSIGQGIFGGIGYSIFTYTLHIPASLPAGSYEIDVVATYESSAPSTSGLSSNNEPGESDMPIYIYVYGTPSISVTATPSPQITPGMTSLLTLAAENSGTDTARNVNITILSTNGIAVSGPSRISLGTMAQGVPEQASTSVYALTNISAGTQYIPMRISYTAPDGMQYVQDVNAPVSVSIPEPDVVVSIEGSQPAQLYAGSNASVELLVQNIGGGTAKNVSINVESSKYLIAGGAASTFFIGSLPSGASTTETTFISANRSSGSAPYYLPVNVSYKNGDYSSKLSAVQYVPINMQNAALFNVTSVIDSLAPGTSYASVTFSIRNTGSETAQEITLSLQSIYPITVINSNNYVNSLAPGQEVNVTFYVSADSRGKPGEYPVTIYEQWRQPNGAAGQQYSASNGYYVTVGSGAGSSGSIGSDAAYAVIAIVIVVAIAMVLRRRRAGKGARAKKAKE